MTSKKSISGAEAVIEFGLESVIKRRIKKNYRLSVIDDRLRKSRTKREAKVIDKLNSIINVPKLINIDEKEFIVEMELIDGPKVRDIINKDNYKQICESIGVQVAKMHGIDIIHGDLTTSNFIYSDSKVYFIDFGLSFFSKKPEDLAVDLHLLKHAFDSKHPDISDKAFEVIVKSYSTNYSDSKTVLKRLENVESRGRNKLK